ncbi:hypothetical protein [Hymenobacter rubidus]|uniref:hypothetical protein n=1 Tax=Hymenobacter rubidus TaxID=1441626 RepID=UPI00191F9E4C|nr:hypothetical protein [Hymenobacter rubidus]
MRVVTKSQWKRSRTGRAQKNRFKIRNGGGAKTRNRKRKIGETDGGQDLPVSLRHILAERPTLHQLFIGLKHDAKLRNVYAGQITGHIKFFLRVFLRVF